jgi:hypothetical protein
LALIAEVAGRVGSSPQHGFGACSRSWRSDLQGTGRDWSKGHYLNATAGTMDYIMGGFTGFYTSKVLLQDTVNGETGGGSSAIPIATGIFSTWRAAGIMRPVHPNLHIACDPNPSCDLLPCYLLIRVATSSSQLRTGPGYPLLWLSLAVGYTSGTCPPVLR